MTGQCFFVPTRTRLQRIVCGQEWGLAPEVAFDSSRKKVKPGRGRRSQARPLARSVGRRGRHRKPAGSAGSRLPPGDACD